MIIRKRRSFQQIMEDVSIELVRAVLPDEWVVHEYKPDYGIDFVVELFQYLSEQKDVAETLGELFFVQAKSIRKTSITHITVHPRNNIERSTLVEDIDVDSQVEVVKFKIEVPELTTIQSMGAALPVLLFLVSLDLQRVFFICLNDVIDKCILPDDASYNERGHKIIYIPVRNELSIENGNINPLRFYAKRAKLYALFAKISYQHSQVMQLIENEVDTRSMFPIIQHFANALIRHDVWQKPILPQMQEMHADILRIVYASLDIEAEIKELVDDVPALWGRLNNLANIYEEVCREWYLPTYLGGYAEPFE